MSKKLLFILPGRGNTPEALNIETIGLFPDHQRILCAVPKWYPAPVDENNQDNAVKGSLKLAKVLRKFIQDRVEEEKTDMKSVSLMGHSAGGVISLINAVLYQDYEYVVGFNTCILDNKIIPLCTNKSMKIIMSVPKIDMVFDFHKRSLPTINELSKKGYNLSYFKHNGGHGYVDYDTVKDSINHRWNFEEKSIC